MKKRFLESVFALVFLGAGLIFMLVVWPMADIVQTVWNNIVSWPWEDTGLGIGSAFAMITITFVLGGWLAFFIRTIAFVINPESRLANIFFSNDDQKAHDD